MKNVVVFGGGTGLSHLLSGLKLFPVNVTAIISVADDGSSTGVLKRELSIPAVGDIGKVMLTMANANQDLINLLSYRFDNPSLENHPIRILYDFGCQVCINTDNRTVSNVTLIDEYENLIRKLNFSVSDLIKMNIMAINNSFLNDNEKQSMILLINEYTKYLGEEL